jgi:hypothetical protein
MTNRRKIPENSKSLPGAYEIQEMSSPINLRNHKITDSVKSNNAAAKEILFNKLVYLSIIF